MDRLPWQGWARELAMADAWVRDLRQVLAKPDPCWEIESEIQVETQAESEGVRQGIGRRGKPGARPQARRGTRP